MDGLRQDLAFALRQLRRGPGFTTMALLTLALGIGASTAVFSVADSVILRPLPFPEPDRLVRIWETTPAGATFSASDPNYLDFRERNRTLDALAAYREAPVALTGSGEPERLAGIAASHTLFPLLGASAAIGRTYGPAEDVAGTGARVAVLSHDLWARRFGADPSIVGRSLLLDGEPHVVTGVMRPGFDFAGAELWVPLRADTASDRGDHWLHLLGRLRPGVSLAQAEADLRSIAARIGEEHPHIAGWGVEMKGLTESVVGPEFSRTVLVLLAAVGLLMLMACVNLANLLLARGSSRQTEMGIRTALGAGRGRLARQLLTESVVLAVIGGTLGLLLATWAIDVLKLLEPSGVPRLGEIGIGTRTVAFTASLALIASVGFGLAPAIRASRTSVASALGFGARGGASRGTRRLRDALVIAQISLALVLLVGAGLMMRSLVELLRVDPGFAAEHVTAVPVELPEPEYATAERRLAFYEEVTARLAALPGVEAVGATVVDPFGGWNLMNDVTPEERAAEVGPGGYLSAAWRVVTPGFFDAMGTPLIRGDVFPESGTTGGPPTAVVTETLAARLWPGQDPVGKRFYWGGVDGTPRTVIGVVGDYRDVELAADPAPVIFLSHAQLPMPAMTLLLRASAATAPSAGAIRETIWAVDPNLPLPTVRPLDRSLSEARATPRFRALLLGAFALAALLLAAVGIYGVTAFTVAQRTREIGVRIALGAAPGRVGRLVVAHAARLAGAGVAIGLLVALALSRYLESLLFRTAALDPLTFVAVPATLCLVALLASWAPARRALRVDPMVAIRAD